MSNHYQPAVLNEESMICQLADILQFNPKNLELYQHALSHRSLNQEAKSSYERLEFLGDRVLSLVVCELLYQHFPEESEGQLSKRLAHLVRGETLAMVSDQLNLHQLIRHNISLNEEHAIYASATSSALTPSVRADVLEALIGAIYLDYGLGKVQKFIKSHFLSLLHTLKHVPIDPKSALQEWTMAQALPLPLYQEIERTGPAHNPFFTFQVDIKGYPSTKAQGSSIKQAQTRAAEKWLKEYTSPPSTDME